MKFNEEVKIFKRKFLVSILIIDFLSILFLYIIMPTIQNFPPLSETFAFQAKVQVVTHIEQYSIILVFGFLIHWIMFNILIKNVCKYLNKFYNKEEINYDELKKVRRDCLNMPYQLSIFQLIAMLILSLIFNFIVLAQPFAAFKFTLSTISISSIIAILLLIVCQKFLNRILESTYEINKNYEQHNGYRIKNSLSLQIQMTPFVAVVLILLSLIGYSKAMEKQGDAISNYYEAYINAQGNIENISESELKEILEKIPLYNENNYYYIINPNNEIYVSSELGVISEFVLDYRDFFYEKTNGRLYEQFGIDEQLYSKKLIDSNGKTWYIGFKFEVIDYELFVYYLVIDAIILGIYIILSYVWAKNMSNNTNRISENLNDILSSNEIRNDSVLPIMSNDEVGDLAYYYNKIQKKLLDQQATIASKERFSAIGEIAARMAHNINNPASTVGNTIPLLYSYNVPKIEREEYIKLLDNMKLSNEKVRKIVSETMELFRNNLESEKKNFDLTNMLQNLATAENNEILKVGGNINLNLEENITVFGTENQLYNVIVNMVKNAVLSYEETNKNGNVDITTYIDESNFINIEIKDNAGGIVQGIQDELFNKIITSRGIKGTGLGLYMAKSTISLGFNGQISFISEEGIGTTFIIKIPNNKI